MKERIIIILGSPNDPDGMLSETAKSRLELCLEVYKENDRIICTGGWGAHFNTSERPHSFYAEKYLKEKGVPFSCFLNPVLSSNTVEDAVMAKKILSKHQQPELIVLTSDFHVQRAELIFKEILKEYDITFLGAKNRLSTKQLEKVTEHEKRSIDSILRNGLYY